MKIIFEIESVLGKKIRLTGERWQHIYYEHPEIDESYIKRTEETLTKPDVVVKNRKDPMQFLYHKYYSKTYFGGRYLVVVAKHLNSEGFIITLYLTSKIKIGEIAWKKS